MQIKGAFKCPQCGGEFDKCRPSGPGRIWALCIKCDLVAVLEDYQFWNRRMQKFRHNLQYGGMVVIQSHEKMKKKFKEKEKEFNPTER